MQTAHPLPQSGAVSSSRTTRRHVPRWAWIVLALLLVAAGVAWYFQSRATPTVTTTTVPLTRGDLMLSVNGSGAVAPAASVDLPFQVAGQVTAVKVAVGDVVTAGQPLATLDTRDLQNQVAAAQAAVQAAQAKLDQLQHGGSTPQDLTSAQAAVQAAQATAHKTRTGNVTAADIQSAQAALTKLTQGGTAADIAAAQAQVVQAQSSLDKLTAPSAPADIAAGQASLASAQAQLQTAQLNLDRATLPAPFDGVVAAVDVTPGTIVSASTVAITVIDRSTLHLTLSLSESDAASVQVGQPVQVTFDALPNTTVKGTVTNVAPNATTVQNVVTYQVLVSIDPGTAPVKAGMSATAIIQTQTISGALLAPSRAIQTRGANQVIQVDLAQSGSAAQPTTIQIATGASANGQTVITKVLAPAGLTLTPGEQVVVPSAARTTTGTTTGGGFGGAGGRGGAGSGIPFLSGGRGN